MASLADNVGRVVAAKTAIADAVAKKGVEVPVGTGLSGLAALVGAIPSGGPACTLGLSGTDGSLAIETIDESPMSFYRRYYKRTDVAAVAAYASDSSAVGSAESAFYGCSAMTYAALGGKAWCHVDNCRQTFGGCKKLVSLTLPDGFCTASDQQVAASMMFYNCKLLASLTLPDGFGPNVTSADYMFAGCSSLKELVFSAVFGANLVDIRSMFANCESLVRVVLPPDFGSVLQIGQTGLFYGCSALEEIEVAGGEGSPYASASPLDLSESPKLSRDSLVRVISGLPQGYAAGGSILTLGDTLLGKLTDEDALAAIEGAKSRNWTIK